MKLSAFAVIAFGGVMLLGTLVDTSVPHASVAAVLVCLAIIAAGALLFWRAQVLAVRQLNIERNRKLVALAHKSGTLTAAQVELALALTAAEANRALSHLVQEGLAQFDVDADGAPVYKVAKVELP